MQTPRTAIVTGASSGIGAATALELGRRGWRVALGARRVPRIERLAKQVEAEGGPAFAHALDVTDPDSVDAFCGAAEAALGPIDLLVNNAGQNRSARIDEATPGLEAFARVLAMETEGTGVRSILVRVGPTWSEFNSQMPRARLPEILQSWKYWGVQRNLNAMPAESVARAIVRAVAAPVEDSYTTVVEVQPGGRSKEYAK